MDSTTAHTNAQGPSKTALCSFLGNVLVAQQCHRKVLRFNPNFARFVCHQFCSQKDRILSGTPLLGPGWAVVCQWSPSHSEGAAMSRCLRVRLPDCQFWYVLIGGNKGFGIFEIMLDRESGDDSASNLRRIMQDRAHTYELGRPRNLLIRQWGISFERQ